MFYIYWEICFVFSCFVYLICLVFDRRVLFCVLEIEFPKVCVWNLRIGCSVFGKMHH